jgi:hypothetical protein
MRIYLFSVSVTDNHSIIFIASTHHSTPDMLLCDRLETNQREEIEHICCTNAGQ